MSDSVTIEYFGRATVEMALANHFAKHGANEKVRDDLAYMAIHDEDNFFQMVCDFVEKNC